MCVQWTNDWEVAVKDITAYKFVRKVIGKGGKVSYESPLPLDKRNSQAGGPVGAVLTYKIGKKITSEQPGIYCVEHAIKLDTPEMACLEVTIPKGARFRRGRASMRHKDGQDYEYPTINSLCIKPKRECDDKDEYPRLRPTTPDYSTANWGLLIFSKLRSTLGTISPPMGASCAS